MTMGPSWRKDKCAMGVFRTAVPGAARSAATFALSVSKSTANKARDNAWRIGDQAMKKAAFGTTRGCFV
jgi:hypothetical protein